MKACCPNRFLALVVGALLLGGCSISGAAEAAPMIRVGGEVGKPGTWSIEHLRKDFASELKLISYPSHGEKHESNCVPLVSLLKAAGVAVEVKMDPKADPKTKNQNLRLGVVVEASDGYTAVFSLAELMPEIGGRAAWLALDADGMPLSPRDGPARLIVPDDKRPGRWIHGIQSVWVVHVAPPTTKPTD